MKHTKPNLDERRLDDWPSVAQLILDQDKTIARLRTRRDVLNDENMQLLAINGALRDQRDNERARSAIWMWCAIPMAVYLLVTEVVL